ncbi:hypothetical protein SAMN05877809_1013 [Rhodobacter sp. JA431]|uniref:hypothetical protein n=1 Tax=Rhodobacter sp. JA431 TaxID=570013 RepID=UPI000BDBA451|nr:hypothetical protein [Rhodobacter sp. JA431]SOB89419.1 hypothetical protein SAMN05877809_1013 [Rhodobacter sp. JA431]
MRKTCRKSISYAALVSVVLPISASAQTYASNGYTWSSSWGFASATDRSVAVSQAQTIRNAEAGVINSQTIYETYYDNRNNYVEVLSDSGDVTTDFQNGDEIGENTYAVGSLNTGSTEITIEGDGNTVDAVNSAATDGCVDGSVVNATPDYAYLPVVSPCE